MASSHNLHSVMTTVPQLQLDLKNKCDLFKYEVKLFIFSN